MRGNRHDAERSAAAALKTAYPPERAAQAAFDQLLDRLNAATTERAARAGFDELLQQLNVATSKGEKNR